MRTVSSLSVTVHVTLFQIQFSLPPDPLRYQFLRLQPLATMSRSDTSRVKEVASLISSQGWTFNDFLIAFYSSDDPFIAARRGSCLTKTSGARYAPERLLDLWLERCPPGSQEHLKHTIVGCASRIVIKETDKACGLKSLHVSTTSVTADDLDESFLLPKIEMEYARTLPHLWFFLDAIISSPNRSEQQKQELAESKEDRAKRVEFHFATRSALAEHKAGMHYDHEHPSLRKKSRNKCIPNNHGALSWYFRGIKTCCECLQPYGGSCQLRVGSLSA